MKLSSRRILILILATFAVVAVACSSEDTLDLAPIIDAGAATAEAAASQLAEFPPITVSLDDEPAAFLDAIPETERQCLEDERGDDRYTAIRNGEERLGDETLGLFPCIAWNTLLRVMVGGMTAEIGGLSIETQACMIQKLSAGNTSSVISHIDALGDKPSLEEFGPIMMDLITEIPVTFCLNEEERAKLDDQNQFGTSISDLECMYDGVQSLGLDFSTVFEIAPAGFEPPAEYLKVASDCGFPVDDGSTSPTPITRDRSAPSIEPVSPSRGTEAPSPEIELIPIPVR